MSYQDCRARLGCMLNPKCSTLMKDETQYAASLMAKVQPQWRRIVRAGDALGLAPDVLLHAGPPLKPRHAICQPLLNAACAALIFEGRADHPAQARELIQSGVVKLEPAQDRGLVTPLAAVVSTSMWLHEVVDAADDALIAYAPLNEGGGPALRFGLLNADVIERLHFVHGTLAPALDRGLREPIDLLEIAASGLAQGDELHGRTGVGSKLLAERLAGFGVDTQVHTFFASNPHGFLNPWMAACACMMGAARRYGRGRVLIAAGGNGEAFGMQLSDAPGLWISARAEVPAGPALSAELAVHTRLLAIGDSAVIDALGFGALALDVSPAHAQRMGGDWAHTMATVSSSLLLAAHPTLLRRIGLDASRVRTGTVPGVCLAALDAAGEHGVIGVGIALHPIELYVPAKKNECAGRVGIIV